MNLLKTFSTIVFTMTITATSALAACSNASVNGTFGFLDTAAAIGGIGTGLGQISFDGNGNVATANSTFVSDGSTGWQLQTNNNPGSYSISTNCTGTISFVNPDGSSGGHFRFVLEKEQGASQFIQLDNGNGNSFEQTGFTLPQGNAACGLNRIKRTFAANLSGHQIGMGPIGYVGQVILDGKGNVTGTMTVNLNGSVATGSIIGTYTEGANCVGTAAISSTAFGTVNLTFVVVNSGNELLAVETDTNTVVSGTLQAGLQP